MIYEFLDKKTGLGAKARDNEELAQELWKPGIKKFKRKKVYARFKMIFRQQIWQKWDHFFLEIEALNIYYV